MADILNFGSLNIDYVYRVDAFVRPAETKSCRTLKINCGGKGLNQSIAAARAGLNVMHAGVIGRDGGMLEAKLAENGVDLSLCARGEGVSGHAIIQVDDAGQNCILLYGGTNQSLDETYIAGALDAFGKGGVVLLQNETNLVGRVIELAHAQGLTTVFNAAPMNETATACPMDKLDWLVVNEVEGAGIAGCDDEAQILPTLRKKYPKLNILLTQGKRGAVCLRGDELVKSGSFRVKAVDTTAAGDTFTGFFLYGLTRGLDMQSTLRLAAAASALAVQKPGAADSVPTLEEVNAALKDGSLGEIGEWGGWGAGK